MNKQIEALKMAIEGYVECLEDMADWAAYASDYFQDKHDLEGNIQAHKQKIQSCKEALASNSEALEQEEVTDAELISYRQGYEQGKFDALMDAELEKSEYKFDHPDYGELTQIVEQPAQEPVDWLKPIGLTTHPTPQQEIGEAEIKQMLNDIEYYKNRLAKYEDVL